MTKCFDAFLFSECHNYLYVVLRACTMKSFKPVFMLHCIPYNYKCLKSNVYFPYGLK
uniref:Uncharacterized protein n=1 Tax=Kalanchoe fedtschenkoi TaxID=63787 RepID=A0A7N0TDF1_KALFE